MLRAGDFMTRDVVSIGSGGTIVEAARLMIDRRISGLPVIDGGHLAGIVSEGDLVHRAEIGTGEQRHSWWLRLLVDPGSLAENYTRSHARYVGDVMTKQVHTLEETTPIAEIAALFDRHRIKRAPVMKGGRVAGIVSLADLLRLVLDALQPSRPAATADDAAIRAHLLEELARERWATTVGISVEVSDGIVSLWGNIGSESERVATRVLAQNIAGVKAVEDHRVVLDFPNVAL